MYGYDYEDEVMLMLRFLKRLYQIDPDLLDKALDGYEIFDEDMIYELMLPSFCDLFSDYVSDWSEEVDMEVLHLAHPAWDRFLALSQEWSTLTGTPQGAARQKFEDIVDFFALEVGDTVHNTAFLFSGTSVQVEMWMSPDCYEVPLFVNMMMDLLDYLQRECELLEAKITAARSDESRDTEEITAEEAA